MLIMQQFEVGKSTLTASVEPANYREEQAIETMEQIIAEVLAGFFYGKWQLGGITIIALWQGPPEGKVLAILNIGRDWSQQKTSEQIEHFVARVEHEVAIESAGAVT